MDIMYPFILTFMFTIRINGKWKFKIIHKVEFDSHSIENAQVRADILREEFAKDTGTNMDHIVAELKSGIL